MVSNTCLVSHMPPHCFCHWKLWSHAYDVIREDIDMVENIGTLQAVCLYTYKKFFENWKTQNWEFKIEHAYSTFLKTGFPSSFRLASLSSLLTPSSPLNRHWRLAAESNSRTNPSLARICLLEWGMMGESRQLFSLRLSMATERMVFSHEWSEGSLVRNHGSWRCTNWLV